MPVSNERGTKIEVEYFDEEDEEDSVVEDIIEEVTKGLWKEVMGENWISPSGNKIIYKNDYELKAYVEKSIKEDKKSPEVIAKEIKKMPFKTNMCARTIRNNIYAGDIYDIKSKDMIIEEMREY